MRSQFIERTPEINGVWSVKFSRPSGFEYSAGDYVELELNYPPDGGRRWFSLSSAPIEEFLQITFRLPDPHSHYKNELIKLQPGDTVEMSPPMGNFNLPNSPKRILLVGIGIGATPFRSMIKDLSDAKQLKRWDIKLVCVNNDRGVLFEDVFEPLGASWIKLPTKPQLTTGRLLRIVPDLVDRTIYLAGPQPVTEKLHEELKKNIPLSQLRLSYFPGYKS